MKLIVGLGNPGREYERTRHNAGFRVVDELVRRHAPGEASKSRFASVAVQTRVSGEACLLLKPTTYMNRSGRAVAEALAFYKADATDDLLVIVDDLALPAGQIRMRSRGGAGGHNGLTDIERVLGGDAYPRLRVGIDEKPSFMNQADYVLGRFTDEQEAAVAPAIKQAADAAECFVSAGINDAMNRFNQRTDKPPKRPKPEAAGERTDEPSRASDRAGTSPGGERPQDNSGHNP